MGLNQYTDAPLCQVTTEQLGPKQYRHTCTVCGKERTTHFPTIQAICGDWRPPQGAVVSRVPPPDVTEAAEKLGVVGKPSSKLVRLLATWMKAGYPERSAEEVERLSLLPCQHRKPSGLCLKCGCGASTERTIYCVWLCRMTTAKCGGGMW